MMLEATVARDARLVMADRPRLGDSTDAPELPVKHTRIVKVLNTRKQAQDLRTADTPELSVTHIKTFFASSALT